MLWTGRFCSTRYTFIVFPWVRGSIEIDLPEDFYQEGVLVATRVTMEYDAVYQLGEKTTYTFTRDYGSQFHASSDAGHDIHFEFTKVDDNRICGTYYTLLDDEGCFWLDRGSQ
jgi:hypothetical protein